MEENMRKKVSKIYIEAKDKMETTAEAWVFVGTDHRTSGRCVEGHTGNIRGNGQAAVAPDADQDRRQEWKSRLN